MSPRDDATRRESGRTSQSLNLTTGGLTLLGVLLSIGATVGFGLKGDWWLRAAIGLATTIILVVLVKMGTASGRGPIAKLANWVIGSADRDR